MTGLKNYQQQTSNYLQIRYDERDQTADLAYYLLPAIKLYIRSVVSDLPVRNYEQDTLHTCVIQYNIPMHIPCTR